MKEYKAYQHTVKQRRDDGGFPWTLTKKLVDRQGEVVMPLGMRLPEGKKSIPTLWVHGFDFIRGDFPVGNIPMDSIKASETEVEGIVYFDSGAKMKDAFAQQLESKVVNGSLDSGSIGFNPKSTSNDPVMEHQNGRTILEWELLEFSIVPIPANQGALMKELKSLKAAADYIKKNFSDEPGKKSVLFDSVICLAELGNRIKTLQMAEALSLNEKQIAVIESYIVDLKGLIGHDEELEDNSQELNPDQDKVSLLDITKEIDEITANFY